MTREHGHHHGPPWGFRRGWGCWPQGRWYGRERREDLLRDLEEYQRDLEQRIADVADMIRRLREKETEEQPTEV